MRGNMCEEEYLDDEATCWKCSGDGFIIVCIDDVCRGAGECMHGDGEDICPVCNGDGYL
jgi:hypothetical protein